jgi:hypothetical protein
MPEGRAHARLDQGKRDARDRIVTALPAVESAPVA